MKHKRTSLGALGVLLSLSLGFMGLKANKKVVRRAQPETTIATAEHDDETLTADHVIITSGDEQSEPQPSKMNQISLLSGKDLQLFIGGKLKDEFFVLNRAYTLRSDYGDQNDYFRHKLNLDLAVEQGKKRYGKPASQAAVRLTNYVLWQDEANYTPLLLTEVSTPEMDNLPLAKNLQVKTLVPLIFVEQAWFKINFDTFTDACRGSSTFLKVGYFPYSLGRGVSMGIHEDLAVDYLGWAGEGGYTRYPVMPPGILAHHAWTDEFSTDVYFNLWRETNASISDTLIPSRKQHLGAPYPQRGPGKDRFTLSVRGDWARTNEEVGSVYAQPYLMYTKAPELSVEFDNDSSAKIVTIGTMLDWRKNGWTVNVELASQFGEQTMQELDRNQVVPTRSSSTGALGSEFSHVQYATDGAPAGPGALKPNAALAATVDAGRTDINNPDFTSNEFVTATDLTFLVDSDQNRGLAKQGKNITDITRTAVATIRNSLLFGNNRFRPEYKLHNQGVMALLDIAKTFDDIPLKVALAGGYIGGDKYPYNDESSHTFHGFIPMRSRYRGFEVHNYLVFDRMTIPRPLNISYHTMFAYNDLKDLSNLQFIGLGLTYYPLENRKRFALSTDIMSMWEVGTMYTWDKKGAHPDSSIEAQINRLRNNGTLFQGWETNKRASKHLGYELDIKAVYKIIDHCDATARMSFFIPGKLYKDLDGQPNLMTQRQDSQNYLRNDGLGHDTALCFVAGLNYKF